MPPHPRPIRAHQRRRPSNLAAAALAAIICLATAGCEVLAVPFAGFENYTVPAAFDLPPQSTVVVVEPLARNPEAEQFARNIAARINTQLRDNLIPKPAAQDTDAAASQPAEPSPTLLPDRAVLDLHQRLGNAYFQLAIDRLGRELQADTVIYAKVTQAELNDQGPLLQPQARLLVRVVDSQTGERLWPPVDAGLDGDASAHAISVGGVHQTTSAGQASPTTRDRAFQKLADDAGLQIARLFYQWERPQPGSKAEAEKRRLEKQRRINQAVYQ